MERTVYELEVYPCGDYFAYIITISPDLAKPIMALTDIGIIDNSSSDEYYTVYALSTTDVRDMILALDGNPGTWRVENIDEDEIPIPAAFKNAFDP